MSSVNGKIKQDGKHHRAVPKQSNVFSFSENVWLASLPGVVRNEPGGVEGGFVTSSGSDLKEVLRAHFRQARPVSVRHPSPEQLAAYHDDQLSSEDEEAIRQHLVDCEDCAAIVLQLAADSESPAVPGDEVSDFEVAAAWRRQRVRLLEGGALPAGEVAKTPAALRRAWATAASLAFLTLALSLWIGSLRQTVQELREPQINPPVLNLEPVGTVRDVASPVPAIELSAGVSRGWLILNLVEDPQAPSYRVEFMASDGRSVWVREGLQKSEANNFRLELTGDLLPPGQYRVVLSARREMRHELIAEYSLRIGRL